jgi:hypothetical protein
MEVPRLGTSVMGFVGATPVGTDVIATKSGIYVVDDSRDQMDVGGGDEWQVEWKKPVGGNLFRACIVQGAKVRADD